MVWVAFVQGYTHEYVCEDVPVHMDGGDVSVCMWDVFFPLFFFVQ